MSIDSQASAQRFTPFTTLRLRSALRSYKRHRAAALQLALVIRIMVDMHEFEREVEESKYRFTIDLSGE